MAASTQLQDRVQFLSLDTTWLSSCHVMYTLALAVEDVVLRERSERWTLYAIDRSLRRLQPPNWTDSHVFELLSDLGSKVDLGLELKIAQANASIVRNPRTYLSI